MGWNFYAMTIVTKNYVSPITGATDYYSRCKNLGGPADFWAGYGDGNWHQYNAKNNSLVSSSKPFHASWDFILERKSTRETFYMK